MWVGGECEEGVKAFVGKYIGVTASSIRRIGLGREVVWNNRKNSRNFWREKADWTNQGITRVKDGGQCHRSPKIVLKKLIWICTQMNWSQCECIVNNSLTINCINSHRNCN